MTFTIPVIGPKVPGPYAFQWRMVQDGVEWFGASTDPVPVYVSANNAAFVSQTSPGPMNPGGTYSATVTMRNTGETDWSAGQQYRLASINPNDNLIWGVNRVTLPTTVPKGGTVAFPVQVTAPSTVGWYNYQWQMVQDGVERFGNPSANLVLRSGVNGAQFVSQWAPATMRVASPPGAPTPVQVVMRNTGSTIWKASDGYKLGAQNPQDNTGWLAGNNRVALPNDVPPGGTATFNFSANPLSVGSRNFQWQMIQDGVQWFGDLSPNVPVQVGFNFAKVVSMSGVPDAMVTGTTYPVSLTLLNYGNTTWVRGLGYRLGAQNPANTHNWGDARAELPSDVPSGSTVTLNFNITAPAAPGSYNFQWQMLVEGIEWFGDPTINKVVQVNAPTPVGVTLSGVSDNQVLFEGVGVKLTATGTGTVPTKEVTITVPGKPTQTIQGPFGDYLWIAAPVGNYTIVATAKDQHDATATTSKTVTVQEDPQDVPFFAKVESLKDALRFGRKADAMALLSSEAQRTYGPIFDVLASAMPTIVATWGKPVRVGGWAGGVDYAVERAGKIFLISFILDDDGNWVIDSL